MNIYSINSCNDISMKGKTNPNWIKRQLRRVEQKILDMLPLSTSKEGIKSKENWDNTSHWVGHPMWNRGIMGATALLTQPTIDYYNHRVDEETRTVSRNRTIAKILAGTTVGMFLVRGPVHKIVTKMTNIDGTSKWEKWLLPKKYIEELAQKQNALKNYRASVAMAIILGVNCITNFVLDAPLTVFLTNYFNKKSGIKENNNQTNIHNIHTIQIKPTKEVNNG